MPNIDQQSSSYDSDYDLDEMLEDLTNDIGNKIYNSQSLDLVFAFASPMIYKESKDSKESKIAPLDNEVEFKIIGKEK